MSDTSRLTISINLLGIDALMDAAGRSFVDAALIAENMGVDGVVMPDHVVMGENTQQYPFHEWTAPPDMSWPEPMTVLSALAGATQSIQLATSVLIAPLRPAAFLAKQAATLDQLSSGRLQFGVGLGWQREEYEASNYDFDNRRQLLVEQIEACRQLWKNSPASYQGETVAFSNIWCDPKPYQQRDIPLWFGWAVNDENARFMASVNAGWACINSEPEFIARGAQRLRKTYAANNIDPADIKIRTSPKVEYKASGVPDMDATLAGVGDSVSAGVTHLDFPVSFFIGSGDEFENFARRLGEFQRPSLK